MSLLSERQKEELYVTTPFAQALAILMHSNPTKSEIDPRVFAREQLHRCIQCAQVGDRRRVHAGPEGEVRRAAGEEVDERDTIAEEGTHACLPVQSHDLHENLYNVWAHDTLVDHGPGEPQCLTARRIVAITCQTRSPPDRLGTEGTRCICTNRTSWTSTQSRVSSDV